MLCSRTFSSVKKGWCTLLYLQSTQRFVRNPGSLARLKASTQTLAKFLSQREQKTNQS